jgi:hypothetical protein
MREILETDNIYRKNIYFIFGGIQKIIEDLQ